MRGVAVLLFMFFAFVTPSLAVKKAKLPNIEPSSEDVLQEEFENSLEDVFPMTPGQIKKYIREMMNTEQAVRSTNPELVTETRSLTLEPGAKPQVLRTAPGFVSTIIFLDSTGKPWPIDRKTGGNDQWFHIEKPKDLKPGNLITISALAHNANSNVSISLASQIFPVVIKLVANSNLSHSDSLISFVIDKPGPNAIPPTVGAPVRSAVDAISLAFLDGVPPSGSSSLRIEPQQRGVSVYDYEGRYYLRTQHAAIWPAWSQVVAGAGDLKVYELPKVPSIMLSVNGAVISFSVGNQK